MKINIVKTEGKNVRSSAKAVLIAKSAFEKAFGFEGEGKFFIQESHTLLLCLKALDIDSIRETGASIARYFKALPYECVNVIIESKLDENRAYALFVGALCGEYECVSYKSKKSVSKLKELNLLDAKGEIKDTQILKKAQIIAASVNETRELVNTIPQVATPESRVQNP